MSVRVGVRVRMGVRVRVARRQVLVVAALALASSVATVHDWRVVALHAAMLGVVLVIAVLVLVGRMVVIVSARVAVASDVLRVLVLVAEVATSLVLVRVRGVRDRVLHRCVRGASTDTGHHVDGGALRRAHLIAVHLDLVAGGRRFGRHRAGHHLRSGAHRHRRLHRQLRSGCTGSGSRHDVGRHAAGRCLLLRRVSGDDLSETARAVARARPLRDERRCAEGKKEQLSMILPGRSWCLAASLTGFSGRNSRWVSPADSQEERFLETARL